MNRTPASTSRQNGDDLLWQQLKSIPAFRALLRSVEARFYQVIDLPQPIIDIGCGDGHFAQSTFDSPLTSGIDPWWGPLVKARRSGAYLLPIQALGDSLPFADHTFASGFSNSVLEHIPDVQPVLNEVSRVMRPGAPFVLTVPSDYFTEYLGGAAFFERLGLDGLAGAYRNLFNRISRHAHTDSPEVWAERLAQAGFAVDRWQYYFSEGALRTLELGHAQGVPSAILHALTGHWILGPWRSNLKWTEQWVRPYYEEPFPAQGAYLFFLARKAAGEPLPVMLPPARPYTLAELEAAEPIVTSGEEAGVEEPTADEHAFHGDGHQESESPAKQVSASTGWRLVVPGLLVALTLLFAIQGQASLRATPDEPLAGLRWFGLSTLFLLLLLWVGRKGEASAARTFTWPSISAIPVRRWVMLPALLLSVTAYQLARSPGYLNPVFPLMLWALAIGAGAYALAQPRSLPRGQGMAGTREERLFTIKASVLLLLVALLLRVYQLGQHPFILNGTEASIGLSALDVLNGNLDNPFSSGWLTNPTLPFFLQAIPIYLLGNSTESLRLFSAFIGAITVPALYIIGQRLFDRPTGLAAAIMLAGSHFHIHYSRSGLTNVWDALAVLLALGLFAMAWPKEPQSRGTWLLSGAAIGLSAYLYTSAHLLPLMLLAALGILLILDRSAFRQRWSHLVAMGLIALVVALPQLLHYQSAPDLFTERAQALGIFENQSGWLNDEALRTGNTQLEILSDQFWLAALGFNATLDTGTSYGPLVPLLNFLFGLLFLLGFILAAIRLRRIQYTILLVWVGVTIIFGGALLLDPPESRRYIIAMPAVSLLAGVALNELVMALARMPSLHRTQDSGASSSAGLWSWAALSLILIAVAIAAYDVAFYFGRYRAEHRFADRNTEIADGMASYLETLDDDWVAHFYGPPFMYVSFPTIPFLATDFAEGTNLFDVPEGSAPFIGPGTGNVVYFLLPERYSEISRLRTFYPSGEEKVISGYYADPLFYVYEVRERP